MTRSLACVALLFAASTAHAALDDVLPKRAVDISTMKLAGRTLRVRTNGLVKEFADADGKVFAAKWRGVGAVDVKSLLGSHVDAYTAAARKNRVGLHQLVFSTPELAGTVVQNGRVVTGAFWVPAHVPKGVKIDALR